MTFVLRSPGVAIACGFQLDDVGTLVPDGGRLAYVVRNPDDTSDIWVANSDGSNARRVTSAHGAWKRPVWSPDGLELAAGFADGDRPTAWVMDADGGRDTTRFSAHGLAGC